jgi:hypothetical protein
VFGDSTCRGVRVARWWLSGGALLPVALWSWWCPGWLLLVAVGTGCGRRGVLSCVPGGKAWRRRQQGEARVLLAYHHGVVHGVIAGASVVGVFILARINNVCLAAAAVALTHYCRSGSGGAARRQLVVRQYAGGPHCQSPPRARRRIRRHDQARRTLDTRSARRRPQSP